MPLSNEGHSLKWHFTVSYIFKLYFLVFFSRTCMPLNEWIGWIRSHFISLFLVLEPSKLERRVRNRTTLPASPTTCSLVASPPQPTRPWHIGPSPSHSALPPLWLCASLLAIAISPLMPPLGERYGCRLCENRPNHHCRRCPYTCVRVSPSPPPLATTAPPFPLPRVAKTKEENQLLAQRLHRVSARLLPDEDAYVSFLKDCTNNFTVSGLPLPLTNRLVLSYAAFGDTEAACQVFDEMSDKSGIIWAIMVSAYSDGCFYHDTLHLSPLVLTRF